MLDMCFRNLMNLEEVILYIDQFDCSLNYYNHTKHS